MSKAKVEKINTVTEETKAEQKAAPEAGKNTESEVKMKVRRTLGFDEFTKAVNNIANGCFDKETGVVNYEVVDFIERLEVIEQYTDFPLPDDIETAFRLVYETTVYDQARKNIDDGQIVRLFAAAEAKMEAKERKANAEATAGVRSVIARFEQLSEQMEGLFGGVTSEQISGVFNALVDGKLDEGKIVDAVMKRETEKDEE